MRRGAEGSRGGDHEGCRLSDFVSRDAIVVEGSAKYDLPSDGCDVRVPIDVPEGYEVSGVVTFATGSSRGVPCSFGVEDNAFTMWVACLGNIHTGRTATASVLCLKK